MDKFGRFFVEGKILNEQEYNDLKNYCSFNVSIVNNKVSVEFLLDRPLSIDWYIKYESLKEKFAASCNFTLKSKCVLEFSNQELEDYLDYFCSKKVQLPLRVKNFLKTVPLITNDDGLVIIQYFDDEEQKELRKIEPILLSFLQDICLNCKKIDYELDKDRQLIEINKKKKLDEIKKSASAFSVSPNSSIRKDNEIGNVRLTKLNDILPEQRSAFIQGEIFALECRELRNKKKLYSFSICDYSAAMDFKAFPGAGRFGFKTINLPEAYLKEFKIGDWVKIQAEFKVDQYANNELTGTINKIYKTDRPEEFVRKDTSSMKRVELLARTKMSAFDSIINTSDLVKRSKTYGWPAISICDRYDVQSYPDAMGCAKKENQKIIYGVEVDKLGDKQIHVLNPIDHDIGSTEYVVFDLETTGLYNMYEDIIEFGAVKVKDGFIVDSIDIFIKPSKPLPRKIVELTHITDAMLENAMTPKQAFKKIIEWIGDHVLVAHNGINFDFRFLNQKLVQHGFEPINNCLIDTLQISRAVHKDLTRHSLGTICRKYRIEYTDDIAHRADFDADVLNKVWVIMQSRLREQGITNINQINSLQNSALNERQFNNFVNLYVKDQQGIKEIYKIVSSSFTTNLLNNPRVFKNQIDAIRDHVIVCSSPTEGDVWDNALNGSDQELEQAISCYDYIFVAPPANLLHEIDGELITLNNVKKTLKRIINTATKLNKKVIAVSDAHYLDKWDQPAYKIYVNSKLLGGKRHRFYKYNGKTTEVLPDLHLRTTNEMVDEFTFLGDIDLINQIVIKNSIEFANSINNDIKPLKDKLYAPKIADATEKLTALVYDNAKKLYGDPLPELIEKRIKRELDGIVGNNYSIIYWISHLLVKKSLDDGYLVGSRGSVGSSLVAFLANISEVNPLPPHYLCPYCKTSIFNNNADDGYDLEPKLCPKCGKPIKGNGHNIPFETFLGFHGEKVPDIDLNFSGEYQPNAHEFVRTMFGQYHTYRAGTIATVASKTAYGYIMNYFDALDSERPIRQAEINWLVNKCVDVKRTTGQHPGGIIIVPKEMDIFDFSPYNYPADDKTQNWYTTHFAFESLHDNLLKFDILGHDDPTTLRMLENITKINPKDIPFNDDAVMKLFTSLESLNITPDQFLDQTVGAAGLPEFGTEFVRGMLAKAKPQSFADLIRISGLSHGTDVWLNNAEELISKMHMTLSDVITCRDDIMLYLINKGVDPSLAFKTMESVRKGKHIKPEDIPTLLDCGVPQWYIDSCNKIKYLFPKAHATAYVIMAWRIAWFKIHYPLAFYAAYFSIRCAAYDINLMSSLDVTKNAIIDIKSRMKNPATKRDVKQKEKDLLPVLEVGLELYLRGFHILPPDLYKSEATTFVIEGNNIITPFNKIDQLGLVGAQSIVEARKQRPFESKFDLMERTQITKTNLADMEKLGMLNDLKEDNQLSLF